MPNYLSKAYWSAFTLRHLLLERALPYRRLEAIGALQGRRVRAMVAHAFETVPYYREVMDAAGLRPGDFRTAADLAQLPILDSDQVAREPRRFHSALYTGRPCLDLRSSGTTGRPKPIRHDAAALFLARAHGHRNRIVLRHFVGRAFGYRVMRVRRPGGSGELTLRFYQSYAWIPRAVDVRREGGGTHDPFERQIARINAFKPDVLGGYGSYLGALFRWAWGRGLEMFRPKVVTYGADAMPDADRRLIEEKFGLPVVSNYGAVEELYIAFQCERRAGFHIGLDHVAVRVVDPHGHTLGPGSTGEIVISNLTNRAMPLLNYKLGDVVTLSALPCPCGRTLPTLERIEGRVGDLVALPDGDAAHGLSILAPLQAVPGIIQVQAIQEDLRRFRLRTVGAADVNRVASGRQLDQALRSVLGADIAVDIEWVDTIAPEPGGKVRAVISRYRKPPNDDRGEPARQ